MTKILDEYQSRMEEAKLEDLETAIARKRRARTGTEEDVAENYAKKMRDEIQQAPQKYESL